MGCDVSIIVDPRNLTRGPRAHASYMKIKDFAFLEPGSSNRQGLQECLREVWPDSYSGLLEGLMYPKNTSTGESNGKTGK